MFVLPRAHALTTSRAAYRLEERIGSGGMAEVWRAIDSGTGATVAVKRLHPGVAA